MYNPRAAMPAHPRRRQEQRTQTLRYLVISDIHANLAALEAVLADAPAYECVWCLGDIVGYGPKPNECVDRIRELPHQSLAGNHDWAALGRIDLSTFNLDARVANAWTQSELTPRSRAYLESLPVRAEMDGFTAAHASPREPVWEYVLDARQAYANLDHFSTQFCLVGHSHVPVVFRANDEEKRCDTILGPFSGPLQLGEKRAIINPGSVGQPRDGDPRASYAILDTKEETWEFRRVRYPVEVTQELMRARGLPRRLVERLALGR
jgi:diadenosine tetraphosphatase ApaH/serine/threonine PP2A family protein phosphatase